MQKKCKTCDKEYKAKSSVQKYCTRECQYESYRVKKIERIKINCLYCDIEFDTLPNKVKVGKSKYCSRKCKDIHQKELYLKDGNPVYGNKHSDEWKEQCSKRMSEKWREEEHRKKVKKGQELFFEKNKFWMGTDEASINKRIETNLERYGVECIFSLKKYQDIREKICLEKYGKTSLELMQEGLKNSNKRTSIEIKIGKLLIENNIKFETQYEIYYNVTNFKSYDFYLKDYNLLIEADGDYWHSNPNKYINEDSLTEAQLINKKNDLFKNTLANKNGYNLVRFWESEIKKKNFKFKLFNEIKKYGKEED